MTELIREYQCTTEPNIKKDISERIYNNYKKMIYKLCNKYNLLGEKEDLIQESFLALIEAIKSFDYIKSKHNFTTHLYNNICWHLIRYASQNTRKSAFLDNTYKLLSLNELMPGGEDHTEYIESIPGEENPEEDAINICMQNWLSIELTKELENLSDEEKQIIEMKFKHRYTYEQIAENIGQSVNYVGGMLPKIYSKMRKTESIKNIHNFYFDVFESIAYRGTLASFIRTNESSTEKAYFKIETMQELLKKV